MLTPRDFEIISFIQEFKAVTSNQIHQLFFPKLKEGLRVANRRLLEIYKNRQTTLINRVQDNYKLGYIYYYGSRSQLFHKNIITELYLKFCSFAGRTNIKQYQLNFSIFGVIPDSFTVIIYRNFVYYFFIEVQLSHSPPNIKKYESLIGRPLPWPVFPRVIVVTNYKQINYTGPIKYVVLPVSLEGFEGLFNQ